MFADGGVADVEAKIGLALFFVGAMAGEAIVRKDGPDVAVEGDLRGLDGDGSGGENGEQDARFGSVSMNELHRSIAGFAEIGKRITIY